MAWEYRIHSFPKKGWIAKNPHLAEDALNIFGKQGWTLVSISDAEGLAVFRRPASVEDDLEGRRELASGLAAELQELTQAIEELNRESR